MSAILLAALASSAGCVGCLGTGLVVHARHGGALCTCVAICDSHGDDPCPATCATRRRFERIEAALEVERKRHTS